MADDDDKVVPLFGKEPTLDIERELVEFCMGAIKRHIEQHGEPHSIALVLLAPDEPGKVNTTNLWCPTDETTGTRIAAYASSLLQGRAIKGTD